MGRLIGDCPFVVHIRLKAGFLIFLCYVTGCIVYTADDLSKSKVKTGNQFNNEMFAWLLHTILATSTHDYKQPTRNVAGMLTLKI